MQAMPKKNRILNQFFFQFMIYCRWLFVVFPQFKTRVFGKDVLLNKYYCVEWVKKKSPGCLVFFGGGLM